MPPKRKVDAAAAAAAGKQKPKKVYGKAPELPEGEALVDFSKDGWRLGRTIGSGGFGRIYAASRAGDKSAQYVVKMEPASNGPLFQEIHFYQRVGKDDRLKEWKKEKGLKFLGIPPFVAAGLHVKGGTEFRFLVMPRFFADFESHRTREGGRLPATLVFRLAACCLDSLEYLHYSAQYVHADLKAENLLASSEKSLATGDEYYLVDYGLARKIGDKPVYKEAPKKAHDGTVIFTSLDAHRGCTPSYRGDVEILAYNIVYWISGSLPWINAQNDPEKVFEAKKTFATAFKTELKRLPLLSPFAKELSDFFDYAYSLDYADRPDFDHLRQLMRQASAKTKSSSSSPSSAPSSSGASKISTKVVSSSIGKAKPTANGTLTPKAVPLLQNFVHSSDNSKSFSADENGDGQEESSQTTSKPLPRSTALRTKTILADDTPPTQSGVLSPRSIVPGKANLRRFRSGDDARRRSSILVKKKYLGPKKTTIKTSVAVTTRTSARAKSRLYQISSSSSDSDS